MESDIVQTCRILGKICWRNISNVKITYFCLWYTAFMNFGTLLRVFFPSYYIERGKSFAQDIDVLLIAFVSSTLLSQVNSGLFESSSLLAFIAKVWMTMKPVTFFSYFEGPILILTQIKFLSTYFAVLAIFTKTIRKPPES